MVDHILACRESAHFFFFTRVPHQHHGILVPAEYIKMCVWRSISNPREYKYV